MMGMLVFSDAYMLHQVVVLECIDIALAHVGQPVGTRCKSDRLTSVYKPAL
jgi:hypothetical protein